MRPLGSRQVGCLRALGDNGGWPGGWYWDNDSTSARILDSLVKRGYAKKSLGERRNGWPTYAITTRGHEVLKELHHARTI